MRKSKRFRWRRGERPDGLKDLVDCAKGFSRELSVDGSSKKAVVTIIAR